MSNFKTRYLSGHILPLDMELEVFPYNESSWQVKVHAPMHVNKERILPQTYSRDFSPLEVLETNENYEGLYKAYGLKLVTTTKWSFNK